MAVFDDIKDRVKTEGTRAWEKIQESSIYNQVRDRFENLTPTMQKLMITGVAVVIFGLLISFPLTSYMSSSESLATYESQRDLIRDLFKIQQDAQNSTGLNPAPPIDALKSRIDDELHQAQLLPEQVNGIAISDIPANLPKEHIEGAVKVILKKLNLRQIVDIGYQISAINPAIKMIDMTMEANNQDSRYYDVAYKFVTLKVPVYVPPPPEEEPSKGKKGAKPTKKPVSADE